jgi:serine/threonine protein kinase
MLEFINAITNKAQHAQLKPNELVLGEKLGSGNDSQVYKSSWLGTDVAVKYFNPPESAGNTSLNTLTTTSTNKSFGVFSNEVAIMMGLRHKNIIMFMGFGVASPSQFIVMEYMPKGSLFKVLGSDTSLSKDLKRTIALGIASALTYMHERNPPILHSDLKSLNILLDNELTPKVTDFGMSLELRNRKYIQEAEQKDEEDEPTQGGTLQWLPPEAFLPGSLSTKKTDIFGFGIILWEILTRKRPWKGTLKKTIIRSVIKGIRPPLPETKEPSTKKLTNLIQHCWHQDPKQRPEFKTISKRLKNVEFY